MLQELPAQEGQTRKDHPQRREQGSTSRIRPLKVATTLTSAASTDVLHQLHFQQLYTNVFFLSNLLLSPSGEPPRPLASPLKKLFMYMTCGTPPSTDTRDTPGRARRISIVPDARPSRRRRGDGWSLIRSNTYSVLHPGQNRPA